jgi:hypothetical protein
MWFHVENDTALVNKFVDIAFNVDGSKLQKTQLSLILRRDSREYRDPRRELGFDIWDFRPCLAAMSPHPPPISWDKGAFVGGSDFIPVCMISRREPLVEQC